MLQLTNESEKAQPIYNSTSNLKNGIGLPFMLEKKNNDYLTYLKPTGYRVPGYDPVKLMDDLLIRVAGNGGHIEQTFTYVDPWSAHSWLTIAQHHDYQSAQNGVPLESIVESVHDALLETPDWDKESLEVIILGPGDGKQEIRLLQKLKEGIPKLKQLYVCLVEISQELLAHAERNIVNAFKDEEDVFLLSVAGDFLHLPHYHDLFFKAPRNQRKRLIVMLGATFSNLDAELHFVRDSLAGFRTGDMFLADFGLSVYAPAHEKEQIQAKDPYLYGTQRWKKTLEDFILGPFKRHRQDHEYIEFTPILDDTFCPVKGSYCIEMRVTIVCKDSSEKNFRVHRVKRYDGKQLVKAICAEGWSTRNGWVYGSQQERALTLWQKR